jgi:predicted transcriptional regulator
MEKFLEEVKPLTQRETKMKACKRKLKKEMDVVSLVQENGTDKHSICAAVKQIISKEKLRNALLVTTSEKKSFGKCEGNGIWLHEECNGWKFRNG